MLSLSGKKVLIVEDEYFIAHEMKEYFVNLGADVLGPVPTVEEAFRHTENADAAVLDINVQGQAVFPVADRLVERSVPIVFFTGYEKNVVPSRLSHVSILSKPATRRSVLEALLQSGSETGSAEPDDIPSMLPKLRLAARVMLPDDGAADRLVEGVLKDAIKGIHFRPPALSNEQWLIRLLQKRAARSGVNLLH